MSNNTFTPAVFYKNPKAALDWLAKAFGFELSMLIESPDDPRMMHSEMTLGGHGRIMVGAEWDERLRSPQSIGGSNTQSLHVDLEKDVDGHCKRARSAGALILQEPSDQFYGARTYRALDLEGHMWTFSQSVREVSREEAEQAIGTKIYAPEWK
ncbi:MAG TPA: VOC family protein [Gammaproteobacteria bacterium]|nr:VOC family protein [Gammaproteobacteria bacterium]